MEGEERRKEGRSGGIGRRVTCFLTAGRQLRRERQACLAPHHHLLRLPCQARGDQPRSARLCLSLLPARVAAAARSPARKRTPAHCLAGLPPHLFVAGDCADAAYVFRPVKRVGGVKGELGFQYQLLATFGFEGTVGSLAVARIDTMQSVDDGYAPSSFPLTPPLTRSLSWVKFFIPVYECDRVYMFKYGDPPSLGYTPDDEW
eukprot:226850-Hanusia_phi.AAC.2